MRIILVFILLFLPSLSSAQVIITEVMCNPEGSDTDYEWLKIKNTGESVVDITNWRFYDGNNNSPIDTTDKSKISVGETIVLARNKDKYTERNGSTFTSLQVSMSLGNKSDNLQIWRADKTVESGYEYSFEKSVGDDQLCVGTITDKSTTTTTTPTSTTTQQTQVNIVTKEVTKYNTVTIEPPQDIYLRLATPKLTNTGVQTRFSAEVYDAIGKVLKTANVEWSFGDGTTARGRDVRHRYNYAGTYVVSAYVKNGVLTDEASTAIKVVEANATLKLDKDYKFVEVFNNSEYSLNLSGWKLKSDYKYFEVPERTTVLANSSVRFSTNITKLSTLKREKYVLLLDSARNTVADSREYKEKEKKEDQTSTTTASAPTAPASEPLAPNSQAKYSAVQDINGLWYVAQDRLLDPKKILVANVVKYKENKLKENEQTKDMPNIQLAAAATEKDLKILDYGAEWLLGLLSVIGFGMFTLKSFSARNTFEAVDKEDELNTESFDIREIK